jgi:hypothetical protein
MASNILSDDRVLWMRQRVCLALNIPTDSFDAHFIDTLERARSAGIARETVAEFLSANMGAGSALFFAARSWTEEYEGKYFPSLKIICAYVSLSISRRRS